MRRLACVLWIAAASALCAAPPALRLPDTVSGDVGDPLRVVAATDGKQVQWVAMDSGLKVFPPELLKDSKTAVVWAQKPGRYRLLAYTGAGDEVSVPSVCVVVVGDAPGPGPGPGPAPVAGFRALVVFDAQNKAAMPASQQSVLTAKDVRDYLRAKADKTSDGKRQLWAIWPDGADASAEAAELQAMYSRKRAQLPWLVIADGAGNVAFEGPLPVDVPSMVALLKKHGG